MNVNSRIQELEEAVEALRVALKPFATAFLILPENLQRRFNTAKHVYEATSQVLQERAPSNQSRVTAWLQEVFTEKEIKDAPERSLRAAEEALELAQACGVDTATLHRLVDYVMGRPIGKPAQEIAGTMVTLYAMANALDIDADAEFETELERIKTPEVIERCRRRQHEKREALADTQPARMDAPGGPQCGCGRPSTHQSGWCGTDCEAKFGATVIVVREPSRD